MEEDNMTMKTVCKVCGRRARRRCPALGAYICTRCCGSRRGPDVGCSGDCEFYPFGIAGYDLWLRLYDALIPKIVKRVAAETDEIHMESLVRSFDAVTEMYGENPDAPAFLAVQHRLLVERDSDGSTLADRWEAAGWTDLKPDEALMIKYWRTSFVTVTEIQRVLDHQRMECIDVFDPTERRFILVDRNFAARATRFSRVFGWLTHYPGFGKLGQFCHEVPEVVYREFLDLIREAAAEEGYDPEEEGY
jgi:hypothetical protein